MHTMLRQRHFFLTDQWSKFDRILYYHITLSFYYHICNVIKQNNIWNTRISINVSACNWQWMGRHPFPDARQAVVCRASLPHSGRGKRAVAFILLISYCQFLLLFENFIVSATSSSHFFRTKVYSVSIQKFITGLLYFL